MFCRAKEDLGSIDVGGDEVHYLAEGHVCVVNYQAVRSLVIQGKLDLL